MVVDIYNFDICNDTFMKGERVSSHLAHLKAENYEDIKRVMAIRTKLDEIEKLLVFG